MIGVIVMLIVLAVLVFVVGRLFIWSVNARIRLAGTAKWLRAVARDESNPLWLRMAAQGGAVSIDGIIMIFIAIIIIYQLIPQLGSDNAVVQASDNASAMAKFAAGLGEWMFPLLGIVAVVFLLFRRRSKGV